MLALSKSGYLLTLFSMLFCFSTTSVRSANYVYSDCQNLTTYIPNSTYGSKLNKLLATLSSNVPDIGFLSYAVDEAGPDSIFGLFLCRGDINTDVCVQCVKDATHEIVQRCPKGKQALIWYDECMLRYSDKSMLFTVVPPKLYMWNSQNISVDSSNFMLVLMEDMKEVATQAAKEGNQKKFAKRTTTLAMLQYLYTMAQCIPLLTESDCNVCLQNAISVLKTNGAYKIGGRVITPSCFIRYEAYRFFDDNSPVLPPPAAAPPSPQLQSSAKEGNGEISRQVIVAIVVPAVISLMLLSVGFCFLTRRRRKKKHHNSIHDGNDGIEFLTLETLQYDLNTVQLSTNNFSMDNKIGEGGFGDVYKGTFPDGQEIAVKRLSTSSRQGAEQFKNEVELVVKLQHRNLVRLLGFCLEREEKILIYEFVPNKSLDYLIFENQQFLDWPTRYKIIEGIARGLLYLHKDSRHKIIHRDIKASNILLDKDLNPKISDFGMAKIFNVDKSQENTLRVVGTYGYMAPEYATHGQFSIKSDVFSFGVLLLEIISGKKNSNFYKSNGRGGLIGYAWNLWRGSTPMELMDPTLQASFVLEEVTRCIHIGLLCVEEDVYKRPTMLSILSMLGSYSISLPTPQRPAFYMLNRLDSTTEEQEDPNQPQSISINEVSVSETCPR